MTGTLVLNATYEPICVVPIRRALVLVLSDKAVVVEEGTGHLRSEHLDVSTPSVVRLSKYVRVPYRSRVPLSRRGVLSRDGARCAYCSSRADTIDHVIPRSRGGLHCWENLVAACARCNHHKADRLLSELGWTLPFTPKPPTRAVATLSPGSGQATWRPYLAWGTSDEVADLAS